jgi:hypothetical protein
VLWPEDFGDPDVYRIYGDESQGASRVNIAVLPDGYRYAEKALMEADADALVAHLRSATPYAEHDAFINYTLVYAYSVESGTDECDCGVIADTAMGTRFAGNGTCGGSSCLFYDLDGPGACDDGSLSNLVAAEQRAPYQDDSVVMVNTQRFGGCTGLRAVYSAGHASAGSIAAHELGHAVVGLDDEYGSTNACGTTTSEINTSLDGVQGAWPEWIGDLGAPREGARYYAQCIYRPAETCAMRSVTEPYCAVCNQHWALSIFGHPRVAPTAPIGGASPASPLTLDVGEPTTFSVDTRLASGPNVTDAVTWTLQGPGLPEPTVVANGVPEHTTAFYATGDYTLESEVTADTNFIKPERNGANVGTASWAVTVQAGACGNGVVDGFDACDGNDLGGATCADQGCSGGTPVCTSGCQLDYSTCTGCIFCGNGTCEPGEDCTSCPADCPSSTGPTCGNGVCEASDGEDCVNCALDCRGKQTGKPSNRYCCGAGGGEGPVGCEDSRCNQDEWICTDSPAESTCCGDLVCNGDESSASCELDCGPAPFCGDGSCDASEDSCTCAADCGGPPGNELSCSDGADEDCDGLSDCADVDDCGTDAACSCTAVGGACSNNGDCCSNSCKGKGGSKTCR